MKYKILTKYLVKEYLKNLILVFSIFILLFISIDITNSINYKSILLSVFLPLCDAFLSMEIIAPFLFFISAIITILKLKKTNQDIAFISLDFSYLRFTTSIASISIFVYILYFSIFDTFFYHYKSKFKYLSTKKKCINNVFIKNNADQKIDITKIEYNECEDLKILNQSEININTEKETVNILIYDIDSNKNKFINYSSKTNDISMNEKKEIINRNEVRKISKINKYLEDLENNKIPLLQLISDIYNDETGIVKINDMFKLIIYKVCNIMKIIIFIYMNYFLLLQNKRSFNISKVTIKIIISSIFYYVFHFILSEKIKYINNYAIQLAIISFIDLTIISTLIYLQKTKIKNRKFH